MANRRMFSLDIVDSDAFLDMPSSAQNLYYHLGMRADDDGFISNPKKIMRVLNCTDDDFKLLVMKRFILIFDTGICVIKHWKMNNYIQSDRYKKTVYKDEFSLLKVKENGSYTELDKSCIQNGYTLETQVRLGKVSILDETSSSGSNNKKTMFGYNENEHSDDLPAVDIDSREEVIPVKKTPPRSKYKKTTPEMEEVFALFDNPAKATWHMRELERVAAQALYEKFGIETLKVRIDRIQAEKNNKDPLFPLVVTPSQLLDKMPNVERYFGI